MVLVLILARLTSNRLPKKHLRLIGNKPLIWHVIKRINQVKSDNKIVLATGPESENKELADYVEKYGVETYFDEDVNDVTGRIARCGKFYDKNIVVTISGDCPLIDPEFIDEGIKLLQTESTDFIYVDHSKYQCLHEGVGFHTLEAWKKIDALSLTWFHKEHPASIMKEKKWMFNGSEITPKIKYRRHDFRMSVDTRADLLFMNEVFERTAQKDNIVDLQNVVELIDKDPNLKKINSHVHQKGVEEKSKLFLIITHASSEIGMGHLSRSIALATELQESHAVNTIFYVNNKETFDLLDGEGFKCFIGFNQTNNIDLKKLINEYNVNCLILDLRKETLHDEFNNVEEFGISVVLIDNLPLTKFEKTMSIIPAIDIGADNQKNVFMGKEYIILRREIDYLRKKVNPHSIDEIAVLSGGSNIPDIELLRSLAGLNDSVFINFIIGPYANREKLELILKNINININIINKNPNNILQEIKKSRMILTPFGVTTYEAIALGTPVLIYKVINQEDRQLVKYLSNNDIVFDGLDVKDTEELTNMIDKLTQDDALLKYKVKKSHQFIDGLGVERVANKIIESFIFRDKAITV